jgi:hypothetical protein
LYPTLDSIYHHCGDTTMTSSSIHDNTNPTSAKNSNNNNNIHAGDSILQIIHGLRRTTFRQQHQFRRGIEILQQMLDDDDDGHSSSNNNNNRDIGIRGGSSTTGATIMSSWPEKTPHGRIGTPHNNNNSNHATTTSTTRMERIHEDKDRRRKSKSNTTTLTILWDVVHEFLNSTINDRHPTYIVPNPTFSFRPHDLHHHNMKSRFTSILIVGSEGSGKTYICNEIEQYTRSITQHHHSSTLGIY